VYGAGASPAPDQVDVGTGVDVDHPGCAHLGPYRRSAACPSGCTCGCTPGCRRRCRAACLAAMRPTRYHLGRRRRSDRNPMTRTKFRGAQLELFDKDIDEHDVDSPFRELACQREPQPVFACTSSDQRQELAYRSSGCAAIGVPLWCVAKRAGSPRTGIDGFRRRW
jgi:hypothetical protein